MAVYEAIRNLVQYGVNTGLLQESDRIYATNQILEVLGLDEYEEPQGACREISLERRWMPCLIMHMRRAF